MKQADIYESWMNKILYRDIQKDLDFQKVLASTNEVHVTYKIKFSGEIS